MKNGFDLVRTLYMQTQRSHLSGKRGFKQEPINFYRLK